MGDLDDLPGQLVDERAVARWAVEHPDQFGEVSDGETE